MESARTRRSALKKRRSCFLKATPGTTCFHYKATRPTHTHTPSLLFNSAMFPLASTRLHCVSDALWSEWTSFWCLTSIACCLLASSLTRPLDVPLCTATNELLVLHLQSGLDCLRCQTRVKRWYDNVILLQTCCDIVLVFSAFSECN